MFSAACKKKLEDTKRVIGILYSKKNRQYNDQRKKNNKRANNDIQSLHRKLKIEQHEPH